MWKLQADQSHEPCDQNNSLSHHEENKKHTHPEIGEEKFGVEKDFGTRNKISSCSCFSFSFLVFVYVT